MDAKLRFDDTAEYRQKELFKLRDYTQEDPKEVAATKFDLNYIALDGAIGERKLNYFFNCLKKRRKILKIKEETNSNRMFHRLFGERSWFGNGHYGEK